jgi:L-fuculose-phosphate aldolase
MLLGQFQTVGRDLFNRGLVASHSGNLSIRLGDRLCITHRGSMLGNLQAQDLVETGVSKNDRATPFASSELCVHRMIYQKTTASAIVHAHPPYSVALSFGLPEIVPCDTEGRQLTPSVPVIACSMDTLKPGGLAEEISEALKQSRVVLVRGHGTFAVGQLMEEAYHYTTSLEESCRILYLLKAMGCANAPVAPAVPTITKV